MKRKPNRPQPRDTSFQIAPSKALGQHFLINPVVIESIADTVARHAGELRHALEIGPGEGALTEKLLMRGFRVTALEKDPRAVAGLRSALAPRFEGSLEVIATDVLRWEPRLDGKAYCVGNLPYYITSDILLWLCRHQKHFAGATIMIQKEVAERLVSPAGESEYGRLSVRMQTFFEMEMVLVVPAADFDPPPKVDSAVVTLAPKGFEFRDAAEERFFESFTALLFSARRKMLRRSLDSTLSALEKKTPGCTHDFWEKAAKIGVTPEIRPDAVPAWAILELMRIVQQMHC